MECRRCVSGGWSSQGLSWCVGRALVRLLRSLGQGEMLTHQCSSTWAPFVLCVLCGLVADGSFLFCPPAGYSGQDFDWADYQKQCGAEAAPHLCFRNVSSCFAPVHPCEAEQLAQKLCCKALRGSPRAPWGCLRQETGGVFQVSIPKREKKLILVLSFSELSCSSSPPWFCTAHWLLQLIQVLLKII